MWECGGPMQKVGGRRCGLQVQGGVVWAVDRRALVPKRARPAFLQRLPCTRHLGPATPLLFPLADVAQLRRTGDGARLLRLQGWDAREATALGSGELRQGSPVRHGEGNFGVCAAGAGVQMLGVNGVADLDLGARLLLGGAALPVQAEPLTADAACAIGGDVGLSDEDLHGVDLLAPFGGSISL